jgi:four helix bundle protein
MPTYSSFEETQVWRDARELSNAIFDITQVSPFARDFSLKDQINGASGSIMDNIAEGFERDGVREFIQFLGFAKGSAGEVRSQLYRALDRKYISTEVFDQLCASVMSLSRQLSGLITYLKKSGFRGRKF